MVTMETSQLLLLLLLRMKTSLQDGMWGLSAPRHLHMNSTNMKHVLTWLPLQDNCSSTILYSVQFQGEFELMFLNSSWIDPPNCQLTPETACDLSFDLGSDSDYNFRVRAHCGSQKSAWTRSSSPFNRRETLLTALLMKVTSEGDDLQVSFNQPPLNAVVTVTAWKRGEGPQVVFTLLPEQTLLHIPALQAGGMYCIRAHVQLGIRSSSTETQCVSVSPTGSGLWTTVATVGVTAIAMVTLLATVFCCISRWRPADCQTYFRNEALPPSLSDWDVTFMRSSKEAEPLETVSVVLVMLSTDQLPAPDVLLEEEGAALSYRN